jgi:hypothetical protein
MMEMSFDGSFNTRAGKPLTNDMMSRPSFSIWPPAVVARMSGRVR